MPDHNDATSEWLQVCLVCSFLCDASIASHTLITHTHSMSVFWIRRSSDAINNVCRTIDRTRADRTPSASFVHVCGIMRVCVCCFCRMCAHVYVCIPPAIHRSNPAHATAMRAGRFRGPLSYYYIITKLWIVCVVGGNDFRYTRRVVAYAHQHASSCVRACV